MTHRGFFDQWSCFLATSETKPSLNRLNHRHRVLIAGNRERIAGKRVLDIASHDGRWSFAALEGGATFAYGIEGRQSLVNKAQDNFRSLGVAENRYGFACHDALAFLQDATDIAADTVFCFGFLYHTPENFRLLELIAHRARPARLIIDSNIVIDPRPIICFDKEDCNVSRNAIQREGSPADTALVGIPSLAALAVMLDVLGYSMRLTDWHGGAVTDWTDLEDYRDGNRVSLVAEKT